MSKYKTFMGGVDLMDRMMALYPHWAYRTNKWTVRVLLHCFMLAVVNIWFEKGKPMRLFDFGLQLSEDLITHAKLLEQKLGMVPCSGFKSVPPPSSRVLDGHLPAHAHSKNGSRCRYVDDKGKSCGGKSRWFCEKCNIPLCLNEHKNCFAKFHTC